MAEACFYLRFNLVLKFNHFAKCASIRNLCSKILVYYFIMVEEKYNERLYNNNTVTRL